LCVIKDDKYRRVCYPVDNGVVALSGRCGADLLRGNDKRLVADYELASQDARLVDILLTVGVRYGIRVTGRVREIQGEVHAATEDHRCVNK